MFVEIEEEVEIMRCGRVSAVTRGVLTKQMRLAAICIRLEGNDWTCKMTIRDYLTGLTCETAP